MKNPKVQNSGGGVNVEIYADILCVLNVGIEV